MKRVFYTLFFFILFFIPFTGCTSELFAQTGNNAISLSYSKYSSVNPLKGFCPYYASSYSDSLIPFSLEWFYVPLKTLRDTGTSYDFSYIDTILTKISSRGHQAVFRVYIDYPGKGDEVPQFIKNQGIPLYTYTYQKTVNGIEQTLTGCYPDFSDDRMISILTDFIKQFGAKYDGDNRVAFITCGLVGHWGEWHISKNKDANGNQIGMPTAEQQALLFKTYAESFTHTKVMARYPNSPGLPDFSAIGFHDDSLTEDTINSLKTSDFCTRMATAGLTDRWKTGVIGGEFRPENQEPFIDGTKYKDYYQDYDDCMNAVHLTWLLFSKAFDKSLTSAQKTMLWNASNAMGYDLTVTSASALCTASPNAAGTLTASVTIENKGIAPFYYDWPVKLALLSGNTIIKEWTTDWKLTSVESGGSATFTGTYTLDGTAYSGTYTLAVQVQNPLETGIELHFSNTGYTTAGTGAQNEWLPVKKIQL